MTKKKDAIIDSFETVVLIETIASVKLASNTRLQLGLRSGATVNMDYDGRAGRNKAMDCIKEYLNILNGEE
jgi:hypothetical protein